MRTSNAPRCQRCGRPTHLGSVVGEAHRSGRNLPTLELETCPSPCGCPAEVQEHTWLWSPQDITRFLNAVLGCRAFIIELSRGLPNASISASGSCLMESAPSRASISGSICSNPSLMYMSCDADWLGLLLGWHVEGLGVPVAHPLHA